MRASRKTVVGFFGCAALFAVAGLTVVFVRYGAARIGGAGVLSRERGSAAPKAELPESGGVSLPQGTGSRSAAIGAPASASGPSAQAGVASGSVSLPKEERAWAAAPGVRARTAGADDEEPRTPDFKPGLLRQLTALLEAKQRRLPSERKVDPQLLALANDARGIPMPAGMPASSVDVARDDAARVKVDITCEVTDELLRQIDELGGAVINSFREYRAVRAWMPLAGLVALSESEGVRVVRAASEPDTSVMVGTVTWEGDVCHRANEARATFGVDGSGLKIGVISDSVDHLAESQASGNLATVTVIPGQDGINAQSTGEGTAMLEIVHDIAPGAELYFATANDGLANFASNIRKLRDAGCQIIVDDITYPNESVFQDDIVSIAVNEVTDGGGIYLSSAGNSGSKDHGTSGVWEGDYVAGGTITVGAQSYRMHQFTPTANLNGVTAQGGYAVLWWSDPLGGAANDYDLFVVNPAGDTIVASSTWTQSGGPDDVPAELIQAEIPAGYFMLIAAKTGAAVRFLHLELYRGQLGISTAGTTRGHNAGAEAYCVAAVPVNSSYPNPFEGGTKNPVETFSSDGPRRVFYHPDGRAITPGAFTSNGGFVRNKPDLAASDGGNTSVTGFAPFYGTSAAAPTVAAIAGLVWSYNRGLSAAEIRQILTSTTLDTMAPGYDRDSGYGIVSALRALEATPSPSVPTIASFTPPAGAVGSQVTITGTKLAAVTGVRFNGRGATFTVDSATRIVATVPAGATSGPISVVAPAGSATSAGTFTVAADPAITMFTPTSGAVGTEVTITGANLGGAIAVSFNDVSAAAFTVDSSSQVRATVPAGATTGRIAVRTPGGLATSQGNFTVNAQPIIGSFAPMTGGVGTAVAILGANLTGTTAVRFNGVSAVFGVTSSTRIDAIVPAGASTGPVSVVTPVATATSAESFVFVPAPVITGFAPTGGAVGTSVTLSGSGLSGVTAVRFNGVMAVAFVAESDTRLTAVVPAAATSGPISAVSPGGTDVSAGSFTVMGVPANDAFANAQTISGVSGNVAGTNVGSSKEANEPAHANNGGGRSVWYRWTAPVSGVVAFDVAGSSFNALLAVYTGVGVHALTPVAHNDTGAGLSTVVHISAVAGVTYYIAVDGYLTMQAAGPPAAGSIALAWRAEPAAPVITGFSPPSGPVGATVTVTGENLAGTTDVSFHGAPAAFSAVSGKSLSATVPGNATTGPITITTPNGTAWSTAGFAVVATVDNDAFANALALAGTAGGVTGDSRNATKEIGEPNHAGNAGGKSLWYRWKAPASGAWSFDTLGSGFDTVLAVYTGSALGALTPVTSNDDGPVDLTSRIDLTATAGTEYRIAVDGYGGAGGTIALNWAPVATRPAVTGFTPDGGPVGTLVTVTGLNLTGASRVTFGGTAAVTFTPVSGTRLTAVVPPGAASGPIAVTTPSGSAASATSFIVGDVLGNDDFADAALLTGAADYVTGDTATATRETGEPMHAGNAGGRSVWYRWTAPVTGSWRFDTIGSGYDTLLAIYTGTSVGALTPVVASDDWGGMRSSAVTLSAVAGTTYRIAVDGYDGDGGALVLRYRSIATEAVLYQTAFEAAEGFVSGYQLAWQEDGQMGWESQHSGGNGIVTEFFAGEGQNALIGYSAPVGGTAQFLWHSVTHNPATQPIVKFSVLMGIVDSTYTNRVYDDFYWSVYNTSTHDLFGVVFNNRTLDIEYYLDDGAGKTQTGYQFRNSTVYQFEITMDFAANRWDASIDGTPIVSGKPITTTGATLNLADVDASWQLYNASLAGDNYMVFDNYRVTTGTPPAPSIVVSPRGATVDTGGNVTLAVVADGAEPLGYQWRRDGTPIPGAIGAALFLENLQPSDAGAYSVVVSNYAGTATSAATPLNVLSPAPVITSDPGSRAVLVMSDVTLSVVAAGAAPLSYQWRKNGQNIPAATGVTLPLTDVQPADSGAYIVVVSNPGGAATSRVATLTVRQPSNYAEWVGVHLGGYGPAARETGADPDGDRVPNLIEYALDGRPESPTSKPLPEGHVGRHTGNTYLMLEFSPNPLATDIEFNVQHRASLRQGAWSGDGVVKLSDGPPVIYGKQVLPGDTAGYLRLRVGQK